MATVKDLYNYIKLQLKLGKPITPFHQAIIDAYEGENHKKTKEVHVSLTKNNLISLIPSFSKNWGLINYLPSTKRLIAFSINTDIINPFF
jgi:hypothetical protein